MASPAAVLSILVKANTGGATTALLRVNQQLDATDGKASKLGKTFKIAEKAVGVSAIGIAAGLAYSVKKAADFEQQMSSLGSVANATSKQMEGLRKQAMKAGADTKFSALEAAQAQTELAKGGLRVKQIMKGGLNSALALAAAGEMELADAAEATVNAMKLFGLRGKDAMKVADGFATAANNTTADVSDFALALKMGGSAAKAAGLTFGETTAMLEALAESGIKGSDAGTSMKAMLVQLAAPTKKQKELTEKLGLAFFDQAGHMKKLPAIARMLGDKLGGMTDKQRLATAKVLAGTDGLRGLLALYDAGPRKMVNFEKGLEKTGTAAETAKKKQDNLKGALEQLGGSVETLGITIGNEALPTLRELADQATKTVNKIGKVFARDDLKLGEKLSRSFEIAKVDAQPWIDKIEKELGEAKIPEHIAQAISAAMPIIAGAAAKAAPGAAMAFIKGFLAADVWGRLAIGAWLLTKMGGWSAFAKLGGTAGGAVGTGMAGGVAASGLKGRLAGMFRSWGPGLGLALAVTMGPEIVKALANVKGKIPTDARTASVENVTAGADKIKQTSSSLKEMADRLRTASGEWRKLASHADSTKERDYFNELADAVDKTGEPVERAQRVIKRMADGSSDSVKQLRTNVRLNMKAIRNAIDVHSAAGKEALSRNFGAAVENIRRSMREGTITTKAGTREIERLMMRALMNFGFSKAQALNYAQSKVGDTAGKNHGKGSLSTFQRGGHINVGKASGDSVPAMLERGEYVLNRNAVGKVGRKALDALNFGAAARFQGGGIVALGRQLQQQGYAVGEHPAFGGVGRHTPGSYHYKGMAIDVNDDDAPGGEAASLDRLYARLKGMPGVVELLWRVAGHFDHLHVAMSGAGGKLGSLAPKLARMIVGGPDSPLKALAQAALDKVRGAGQSKLDAMGGSGSGSFQGWSGSWVDLMGKIAQERGWNLGDWKALVNKESGGNPNATNPSSGAFGLGQFLGKTAQAYAKFGALSHDPVDQIRAMAQYIGDRYGNPSSALAFHNQHNWYSQGGPVGMKFGGNPFANKSGFPNMKFSAGLGKLLGTARHGKPRQRRKALGQFLKNIKGVGLPAKMEKNLKTLSENADIFGQYADRAGQLNALGEDGNVITPGVVNGRNEVQWLTQELETLFQWRNAIIRAQEIIVAKRDKITGRILQARQRMQTVVGTITGLKATRKTLTDKLSEAQKHPKGKRALIKGLKGSLGDVDRKLRKSGRERDTLKTVLGNSSGGLLGQRAGLNTTRGDLLSSLGDVQGAGSPMEVLKALPGLGVLGGRIFDTQMRLRDLTGEKPNIVDTDTSQSAELLSQLLREANLRTAVSERQFDVFKNMPQFGGGGIVPGVSGSAVPAVVHAGEGVFTPDQMAAIGGSSVTINVAPGMEWLKQFITVQVDQHTRRQAKTGARGLPGAGGGNLR